MLIIIDTETTGLKEPDASIWQVGAVALHHRQIVAQICLLAQPRLLEQKHREVIHRCCGLSPEAIDSLTTSLPADRAAFALKNWIHTLRWSAPGEKHCLTSYNTDFDRHHLDQSPWSLSSDIPWGDCIMLQATDRLYRGAPRPGSQKSYLSLTRAAQLLRLSEEQTHNALDDARLAAKVAIALDMLPECWR